MLIRHFSVSICVIIFSLMMSRARHCGAVEPNFETQLAPLLAARCIECHNGTSPKGGLDLATRNGFRKGGDSGIAF